MAGFERIIDANANRAREAMRVLEDVARFVLNDPDLSGAFKGLRHELRDAIEQLPGPVELHRDTPGDVGTGIKGSGEARRRDLHDAAAAAGKRLSEALRVIEEAAKTVDPDAAGRIERLRYRGYDAEQRIVRQLAARRSRQWRVCVLLSESLCKQPWGDVLRAAIDHGADCIQVREKAMQGRPLLERVQQVIDAARPAGVSVIVNDRVDVALAADADGAHLGTDDLPIETARAMFGTSLLLGASTHDLDEASRAAAAGADYCGVGAMYSTAVKPDRAPAGPAYLRAYLARFGHVPHLAIGGVTAENVGELVQAGARGVAVSGAVCGSDQPGRVVETLAKTIAAAEVS